MQQPSIPAAPLLQSSGSSLSLVHISSPPIFSVAQHNPVITQPATLTTTISHAPPLHTQETNEDALSSASDVLPPAAQMLSGHVDPSLSLSLPPVPHAIQQHILRDEFVDFNTLLPEVTFSAANTTPSTTRFTTPSARINSFSSWLEAWNIYIATVAAHNPSRALKLLGYQRLIHSANKHFSTSAWLNYDVQFRTLAASNSQLQWNLRHSELWLENLAFQTSSSSQKTCWPCTYCGSTYHFPDRCSRCPFHSLPLSNDDNNSQRDNGSRPPTCREFNSSSCTRNPCHYRHQCNLCGSPNHPAYRCRQPLLSR